MKKFTLYFCVLFFGIGTLDRLFEVLFTPVNFIFKLKLNVMDWIYQKLATPFLWVDKHFLHLGFNPTSNELWPDDNHFGVLYYFSLFVFSISGAIILYLTIRNKFNAYKLQFWFSIYLRYMLAFTLMSYGLVKLVPVQMAAPNLGTLNTTVGQLDKFSLLWIFLGASKPYQMFAGLCELLAALLLLNRKTMVFGLLFSLTIFTNVVAYNYFYNVSVKLFSSFLILINIYLLAPYFSRLFQVFVKQKSVSFVDDIFTLKNKWGIIFLKFVLLFFPIAFLGIKSKNTLKRYTTATTKERQQQFYTANLIINKDSTTIIPDSLLWRKFIINPPSWDGQYATIITNDAKNNTEKLRIDSANNQFILTVEKSNDSAVFNGFVSGNNNDKIISGIWKKKEMTYALHRIPMDSLKYDLTKPQFSFMQRDEEGAN